MTDKELKERAIKANEKYMGIVDEFIASVGKKDVAFDDVQNELCKMLLCLFADWQQERMIDKACKRLSNVSIEDMTDKYDDFDTSEGWYKFIDDFRKAMED